MSGTTEHQRPTRLERWVLSAPDGATFTRRFRWANRLSWRRPIRVDTATDGSGLLVVSEPGGVPPTAMYVARPARVMLLRKGLEHRRRLLRDYLMHHVPISDEDFVVDVGANVGEFSLALAGGAAVRGLAVEPEPLEYEALRRNLSGTRIEAVEALLWSQPEDVPFFSLNDSGDSSIFQPAGSGPDAPEWRRATTLDLLLEPHLDAGGRVRLLKVEAEGAEPEVLQGAARTLTVTDHVAVDVGPERGTAAETTLVPVVNLLAEHGMRPIDFLLSRPSLLFSRG